MSTQAQAQAQAVKGMLYATLNAQTKRLIDGYKHYNQTKQQKIEYLNRCFAIIDGILFTYHTAIQQGHIKLEEGFPEFEKMYSDFYNKLDIKLQEVKEHE